MLEGLVAWFLNTYVGEFVENLNTDQLSIGLLQGEVELENLPLKKDALKYLGIPIEIIAGFIGKIHLHIPLYRLRSEPWVINIEGLYLVAGKVSDNEYNEEKEEQAAQNRKLSRLDVLEAKWKAEFERQDESSSYYAHSYLSWLSYGTSLMSNVIENLQLNIKDIHIRYEDECLSQDTSFACGIIIHHLSAQSTDEYWIPKFVMKDKANVMCKLLEIGGLAIYWDTDTELLGHLPIYELTSQMKKLIENDNNIENTSKKHEYILQPVSLKAQLKHNCSSKQLRSRQNPRLICDLQLENFPLRLNEFQYSQIIHMLKELERLDFSWKYRKWRPNVPIKKDPRKWWKFAIQAHLDPISRNYQKQTWNFVLQRACNNVKYCQIYYTYLTKPDGLTAAMKVQKDDLEQELDFEELHILRGLTMDKIQKEYSLKKAQVAQFQSQGILQRWFPGWTGWYTSSLDVNAENENEETNKVDKMEEIENLKTKLEEELLDAFESEDYNTIVKHDRVCAQLNFSLMKSTVILIGNLNNKLLKSNKSFKILKNEMKPLIEFELSDVETTIETRPRSGSLLFSIKLGAMYLYDKVTEKSLYQCLVSPQNRDISYSHSKFSSSDSRSIIRQIGSYSTRLRKSMTMTKSIRKDPLFELIYDRKPFGSSADHRLIINSHPLDVIYNPTIFNSIIEFFTFHNKTEYLRDELSSEYYLGSLGSTRYETLKLQTKAEIKQRLDQILDGEQKMISKTCWEINLAISAPEIIIPENFQDQNGMVVVFDLGKLHFYNTSNVTIEKENASISDDDEDFITPCSTPPKEMELDDEEVVCETDSQWDESIFTDLPIINEDLLRERLYEKYILKLNDMQVLVSQMKDNWRFAQLRGTSILHVLDRFSVSLQMERQLISTRNPNWPNITICGKLPKLVVHVSEKKLDCLKTCLNIISMPLILDPNSIKTSSCSPNTSVKSDFMKTDLENSTTNRQSLDEFHQQALQETLLLLMWFGIDEVSIEVQSRERSIAELQVTGVKSTFSKRQNDTSMTLCVHSLLLVDALQTFGPDFELLIASHRNVCMDSMSGSLHGSESHTLCSASPQEISSPITNKSGETSPFNWNVTLNSTQNILSKVYSSQGSSDTPTLHPSHSLMTGDIPATDALIMMEFVSVTTPPVKKNDEYIGEKLNIVSVQFNSLDITGNQETIVELVSFMKRIFSKYNVKKKVPMKESSVKSFEKTFSGHTQLETTLPTKIITRTELTFDFHRLNILLLHALSKKRNVGKKVATATMTGARFQASLGTNMQIQGALNGFQVLDLITDGNKHQRILSVGQDPLVLSSVDENNLEIYKPLNKYSTVDSEKAFAFTITRDFYNKSKIKENYIKGETDNEILEVKIRMASLFYTHSPQLLYELSTCATEFKEYMSILASSIKSAAAEVAIGIMSKRIEGISVYNGNIDTSPFKKFNYYEKSSFLPSIFSEEEVYLDLKLDILLHTPVIVLPSTPCSSDVLVVHLGQITVKNDSTNSSKSDFNDLLNTSTVAVEIRDMNLFSLNIEENIKLLISMKSNGNQATNFPVLDVYDSTKFGKPILHNTVIEINTKNTIYSVNTNIKDSEQYWPGSDIINDFSSIPMKKKSLLEICGCVVTPLKINMTNSQYNQVLNTLDNLTYNQDEYDKNSPEILIELNEDGTFSNDISSTNLENEESTFESFRNCEEKVSISNKIVHARFLMPDLTIELISDFKETPQSLVLVTLKEFVLNYEEEELFVKNIQVTLHSLMVEDLLNLPTSKYRYLMKSTENSSQKRNRSSSSLKPAFLSTSCPNMGYLSTNLFINQCSSLPDQLSTQNIFSLQLNKLQKAGKTGNFKDKTIKECSSYPTTPPPSPSGHTEKKFDEDALVQINIILIDKYSSVFATKYNHINRCIDINFNCLETILNMKTWIMVLDFFRTDSTNVVRDINYKESYHRKEIINEEIPMIENDKASEVINSKLEIAVRSLTLILCNQDYEIAKANVSMFNCHTTLRDKNISAEGKLGSISLVDMTPYGKCYPERFITSGEEALHFDIFKYGQDDPDMIRKFDMSIKCRMCSVRYVHTHRFYTLLLNFMQNFNEIQDLMAQIRTSKSVPMNIADMKIFRIKVDIAAGSPVIIIPNSFSSQNTLVADLGNLTAQNVFLFAGSPGTISIVLGNFNSNTQESNKENLATSNTNSKKTQKLDLYPVQKCLLDVTYLELSDINLYSAICIKNVEEEMKSTDLIFPSFIIRKEGPQLLQEKFMLNVQVERNLHSFICHAVPDLTMKGTFSSVYFTVDLEQYKLIRGILRYNLGEQLEEIPSIKYTNNQQAMPKKSSRQVWTTMAIHLKLVNVTVNLLNNHCSPECVNSTSPLAKFDFIKSCLSLETYSDFSRDIDLISHEIRISDTRYKDAPVNNRPNVFTSILQPIEESVNTSLPQAELHYIMKHNCTSFIISLNCMRVMSIFDWSKHVLKFLFCEINPCKPMDVVHKKFYSSEILPTTENLDEIPVITKLYLMDTEIVVVENPSVWDSNAVILKTTASFKCTPSSKDCPITFEFRSLEVFSCILGVEEETALSIIDPVSFTLEVVKSDDGILQLTDEITHLLKVKLENLNLRLSYHDVTMFIRILESFSRQTGLQYENKKEKSKEIEMPVSLEQVAILEGMGYKKEDCIRALAFCKGELNNAAIWLTDNALHDDKITKTRLLSDNKNDNLFGNINLQAMIVTVSRGCLCVIDDCRDSDVPCLEVIVTNLEIDQSFTAVHRGNSMFILSVSYFNRALSGWEPFIEPWKCKVSWNFFIRAQTNNLQKISFQIEAEETLNINITSALLDLYQNIKNNWIEEYYKASGMESIYRRRSPFVPFAVKNDLGCKLWFSTAITSSDKDDINKHKSLEMFEEAKSKELNWIEVHAGQIIPFTFEGRDKLRHKDSHRLRKHQLMIRINGWQQLAPVSVDQVGVFYRFAQPEVNKLTNSYIDLIPTRIVYAVTLEGSARKLITIRSGLLLTNKCDDTIELKMENSNVHYSVPKQTLFLVSHTTLAVPLPFLHNQIWLKPVDKPVVYSSNPVVWQHIVKPGEIGGELNVCRSAVSYEKHYRISVCVKREYYMTDSPHGNSIISSQRTFVSSRQLSHQPGHKIFLLPPLKITNLLPYELHFVVKDNETYVLGHIKPGHNTLLHNIDVSDVMTFEFSCENFQKCNELIVRPSTREFLTRVLMYDNQDRLLMLQARVIPLYGGALKLNISSPYWLINNSGLPLVFRQEGTQVEAAGQSEEHELARSVVPLLFSFADKDASAMCSIRIGHSLHPNSLTQWCNSFNLQKGIRVRHLHVTPRDSRPDWVYTIGIDVRMGRGRYRDTYMVTLSPRYQLDNRSSYKLEFSQKFAVENLKKFSHQYVMSAVPKCQMPFHWPRVDLDNLLCVRLSDIPDCMWSGGFSIDKINSFHVNMRNGHGKSHFLRVEILLQGAKYVIVFTDAEKMPPPLRIDNHSEVPIIYYQTNIVDERLKTSVRPGSCVPYAWDEPTFPSMITCYAPGGATATYNMNVFGEGDKLFYGNFIYLAFIGTFSSTEKQDPLQTKGYKKMMCQDLVLDVPEGTTKIILNRKEQGKRSQLWRMGSTGLLHHEGSSPPQDPRRKVNPKDLERTLVLDIAGLSPLPGIFVPLMLRKPDERRSLTQTWHFTEDGRLCCDHPNLYVQPKDGFYGLRAGQEAVLGPNQPVIYMTSSDDIPLEQAVVPQKLRGGSGVLAVKVIPDGPTRVLQIYDLRQKQLVSMTNSTTDWIIVEEQKKLKTKSTITKNSSIQKQNYSKIEETYALHIYSHLSGGFGISLINHLSEELIYIYLQNIMVEYNRTYDGHSIDGSIQNIQVDNQLRDAERPTLLFVTPPSKKDQQRHLPAVHFTANKIFTTHLNAEIFKHLIITVKNLTVQAEEKLLFKLLQFAGFNQSDAELEKMDENDTLPQRALLMSSACTCRYYFNTLKLSLPQVKLSVLTSDSLPAELGYIKKKMGWKLIRFEDAVIELDPFIRVHPFETAQFLVDSIVEHYKEELKSQAAKILGAVDFLGNPLGLLYDVSDGVNDFLNEGDVKGLIKNVAHGLSDSAAKMTGSLSDSLGLVVMDNHHQEIRKRIKYDVNTGSDHLLAGLKGFGYGLLGGFTSLYTQTCEGASTEGVQGFFSGLGKGLVGTVAKPAVGFLDLATGAASAVRNTSRRNSHTQPERCRLQRVCFGPGGLIPPYNNEQAKGQQVFFSISTDYQERFISYHCLRKMEGMELLLTNKHIFVINRNATSINQLLLVSLENLLTSTYLKLNVGEIKHYIQLTVKSGSPSLSEQPNKRPRFRCDTQALAQRIVEEINYIKEMHEERFYTLLEDEIEELED